MILVIIIRNLRLFGLGICLEIKMPQLWFQQKEQSNIATNHSKVPDSNAGASALAGFIDAPEINAKNKISNPTIPPIATPLNPFNPFVYTT